MKLLSGNSAALLVAWSGILPYLSCGAPVHQLSGRPLVRLNSRDDDWIEHASFHASSTNGAIKARGFTPPKPPPAPKLPTFGVGPSGSRGPVTPARRPAPPPPRPLTPSPPRTPPSPPKSDWKPIPNTQNPGIGHGLGKDPGPMEEYAKLGRQRIEHYEAAIKGRRQQTIIVESESELAKYGENEAFMDARKVKGYNFVWQALISDEIKSLKAFRSPELDGVTTKKHAGTHVIVHNEKHEPISESYITKDGQFMIYQTAFKDTNKGIPGKIPHNELGLQNFMHVAGKNAKNLQVIFLENVQNKEFWAITRQAYNDAKQPFDKVLTFQRGHPETGAAFDRFMGSPNLSSKFYSFANHHNEIGNRVPYKVVVSPKQHRAKIGDNPSTHYLNVAVVFKPMENA